MEARKQREESKWLVPSVPTVHHMFLLAPPHQNTICWGPSFPLHTSFCLTVQIQPAMPHRMTLPPQSIPLSSVCLARSHLVPRSPPKDEMAPSLVALELSSQQSQAELIFTSPLLLLMLVFPFLSLHVLH